MSLNVPMFILMKFLGRWAVRRCWATTCDPCFFKCQSVSGTSLLPCHFSSLLKVISSGHQWTAEHFLIHFQGSLSCDVAHRCAWGWWEEQWHRRIPGQSPQRLTTKPPQPPHWRKSSIRQWSPRRDNPRNLPLASPSRRWHAKSCSSVKRSTHRIQ